MKIIQANKYYYIRAGAERYLFNVSDWMQGQGHHIIPFAMQHPQNIPTPFDRFFPSLSDTEKVRLSWDGFKTFLRMLDSREAEKKMDDLIRSQRPDVCHIHNIYTQLSPSVLRPLSKHGVPIVMTVHDHHLVSPTYDLWAQGCGPDVRGKGVLGATLSKFHKDSYAASFGQAFAFWYQKQRHLYERLVDRFLVPCVYMKRQLEMAGFPSEKIQVSPFGIDARAVTPRFDHDGYLLFAGRIVEQKGIEMIASLARALPDVRFVVAGSGEAEPVLHRVAHEQGNIELVGVKQGDALTRLYQGAIAVLLPSRFHEVFPMVALEAMRAGKPVLASAVGGLPELVEDRVSGFLLSPLDTFGWTEAVLRLVHDHALRERLSRGARTAVESRFSAERHFHEVEAVYRELTEK